MIISILDAKTLNPGDLSWSAFEQFGTLNIFNQSPTAQLVDRSKDADILLVNKVVITADIMSQLPKLKYIGVTATGYNNVDLQAARLRNIPVSNAPGYGTLGVAQHVFALILEISSKVHLHDQAVSNKEWSNQKNFSLVKSPILGLENKTLGVIGLGSIGQKVAEIGHAFGMKILGYNRSKKLIPNVKQCELDQLIETSDFISLNSSLNESNAEMVNISFLKKMQSHAFLINTSRGGLINEANLAEALEKKWIAGAALDVLSAEPPATDHILLSAPNCIITPHNAWAYPSSRKNLMKIVWNNIQSFLDGNPQNIVN